MKPMTRPSSTIDPDSLASENPFLAAAVMLARLAMTQESLGAQSDADKTKQHASCAFIAWVEAHEYLDPPLDSGPGGA